MQTILVIDTGSSSMRGVLFRSDGSILHVKQQAYQMEMGTNGAATMQAVVFETCLTAICRDVAAFAAAEGVAVGALAFTSQRSSVLAVDENGTPLYPILMWYDKRCAPLCAQLNEAHGREMYEICGMRLTPVSSAPKMLWLKQNHPDIYRQAYKLLGIHDYLLYLCTGHFVTDTSLASRTALLDIQNLCWADELLATFTLEKEKLCTLVQPGSIVGTVTAAFAAATGLPVGVPVITAGGDQQCCVLGQGLTGTGCLGVNSGSASYITAILEHPVRDEARETNLNAYCLPQHWVLEASNMGSGTVYQWFNRIFFQEGENRTDYARINAAIEASPAGAGGMYCLPDFAGRGCPYTDPDARGMFLNVGLDATRGHFARALLEGICFDIAEEVRYMQALCPAQVTRILSTGGMTNFALFNQTLADILGQAVSVKKQPETTALGALVSALLGLKAISTPADFFAAYAESEEICYVPNAALHAMYAEMGAKRKKMKKTISSKLFTEPCKSDYNKGK